MATKQLGQRIFSLSALVSKSSASQCAFRRSRTCHGCHAPLDDDHKEYPSGWLKCPLDHWTGCEGGIVEGKAANGSEWRGCPPDYVYVEAVSEEDADLGDGLNKDEITIDTGDELGQVRGTALDNVLDTNLESVEVVTNNGVSDLEVGTGDDIIR